MYSVIHSPQNQSSRMILHDSLVECNTKKYSNRDKKLYSQRGIRGKI